MKVYKSRDFTLLLALALTALHCGKTSFDQGAAPKGTAAMLPAAAESNDRDVEVDDDQEAEIASEPVSVGGAFLNCAYAPTQSTAEEVAVLCEFASQGLDSSRALDLLYGFTTGGSRAQAIAMKPSREDFLQDAGRQVWRWNFAFPRSGIRDGWLYVDIQDRQRVMDALIKLDLAIPSAVVPVPATVSIPAMFRFNSGSQKLGDDGAGRGVETGCGAIDTTSVAMARSRTYTVTLTAEVSLNIVFSNLCGVGTGQTNTVGSFTTAALRNANNGTVLQFNLLNQAKLSYVSAKIPPGVYQLVVTPASRDGALNDFVYSNLFIEGAGITVK